MDCRPEDDLIGILGSPDGNRTNDWMNTHGEPLEIPNGVNEHFFKPAYEHALEHWCIEREEDSYFTYESGKQFLDYEHCGKEKVVLVLSVRRDALLSMLQIWKGSTRHSAQISNWRSILGSDAAIVLNFLIVDVIERVIVSFSPYCFFSTLQNTHHITISKILQKVRSHLGERHQRCQAG